MQLANKVIPRGSLAKIVCGRYALAFIQGFKTRFEVMDLLAKLEPRFNIAPTEEAPVIINEGIVRAVSMRWGLIPSWAKDMKIGNRLINARSETLSTKPAFRAAFKKRRCLVPTTGFYEWKDTESGKIPYYVHLKDNSMFALAGLYEHWRPTDGQLLRTYAIVTTKSNELSVEIHNRMPVILRRKDEAKWISDGILEGDDIGRIFEPYPASRMEYHEVSKDVNNARNEGEELILPVLRAHAKE